MKTAWRSHVVLGVCGLAVMQATLRAYHYGLPVSPVPRITALIAVAILPSSILLIVCVLGLGLTQLAFRAVRGRGLGTPLGK